MNQKGGKCHLKVTMLCSHTHTHTQTQTQTHTHIGRKLKERNSQLAADADLAWYKLFERHDIPKRIIETDEMREAVRLTTLAVPVRVRAQYSPFVHSVI